MVITTRENVFFGQVSHITPKKRIFGVHGIMQTTVSSGGGGCCQPVMVVVKRWPSSSSSGGGGLVVVERWWPLSLSEVVGFAAERVVVVVFGWFRCTLVVVGGILEMVVAVGWVVRGCWLRFHGCCLFGSGS